MCLIFLPWSLQLQPEQLAGGEGIPAPSSLQGGLAQGWAVSDRRRGSMAVQPWQSAHFAFAVPRLREGVAAEITLQENPFPPYLPSGTHLVAYIKVDDLLLPSLLP